MTEDEGRIGILNPNQGLVRNLNKALGAKADPDLRRRLIAEEAQEVLDAIAKRDVIELIDGLCDLLYVTYGAADVFGINLDTARAENEGKVADGLFWGPIVRSSNDLRMQAEITTNAIRNLVISDGNTFLTMKKELLEMANGCWAMARGGIGIDLLPFFQEVHRTNMHKIGGPKREDGKGLKPEGWKPPRIQAMYNRLLVMNRASCNVTARHHSAHPYKKENILPHPEGGWFCQHCGGVFTLFELDVGMELKLTKEGPL